MIKRLMIVIVGLLLAPSMVFANGLLDDLQRYYTFDSTNTDEQGNYNAVDVGSISYDTGNAKIGSASLLYNGQTEGKQVGGLNTDIHGGTKEFTYNFWVELDAVNLAASYDDWIINDWMPMATSQSDFLIAVRNGNWGILGSDNTGVAALQLDGDSASTNWDMITVFRNSTHIGISVNGGTPVTQAYTNTIDTNIANAGLGTSAAYNLLGNLDEVGMWTRALNSTQISDLYNSGSGLSYSSFSYSSLSTGLTNYYSLEESGFNYLDSHGSADFTSGTAPTRITGKINFGQDFQSDSIETSGTNWGTPQTYAFWVDPDVINNGYYFSDSNSGTPIQVYNDGSNRLTYYDGTNTLSSNPNVLSTSGGWQHVVIVLDGSSSAIYIDGSAVGLNTNSVSTTPTMSGNVYMGSYKTGGINLDAGLDEFGVWSRPLSSSEVTELYNGGSGLSYNDIVPYDVTNINNYASRYYAMEQSSGDLTDSTGNYDGVASGIMYQAGGKINYGIYFDGTNVDKVDMGSDAYPSSSNSVFSSCQWVYPSGSKSWQNVWRGQEGSGISIALQRTGDASAPYSDTWRYIWYSGGTKFDAVGGTVTTGAWTHICTTNDGTTARLYQDGTQIATSAVTAHSISGTWNTAPTLGIRPDTNAEKFNGNIDEVAFFDGYTLTQADINFLYASGSPGSNQQYVFATSAPNTNPTITAIADQETNEDEPIPIVPSAFTIGDAEDPISSLTLSYTSSDTALINSTGSITFNVNTTTGVVDMLDITPNANAFGTSTIDVTVTDSNSATNSSSFLLTVFSVNDAPTITPIADQTTTEGATLVINFNVTDVDNPYTDLTYTATAGDVSLIDSATFSNYDGTNQTLTLVAGDYGVTDINVTVQDLQPAQASTQFQYLVNCNTTANYYTPMNVTMQINQGTTDPVVCLSQTFNYNVGSDILTYQWYDFGATMTDIELYVYDSTGGFRRLLNQTTLSTDNGTQTFDYSAINPHYDLLVIAELTDSTRSPFVGGSPARILESTVNQKGQLGSLFSDADGIIYGVLILLLFLTIGIASQSATLTLIFSVLGLFIASKFVLKIPSEFIWITGALVVILLYLIAKLRTD